MNVIESIKDIHSRHTKYIIFCNISKRAWSTLIENIEKQDNGTLLVILNGLKELVESDVFKAFKACWHQKNADENAWWMMKQSIVDAYTPDEYLVLRRKGVILKLYFKEWHGTLGRKKKESRECYKRQHSRDVNSLPVDSKDDPR